MDKRMDKLPGLMELAELKQRLETLAVGNTTNHITHTSVRELIPLLERIENGEREWQDAFDAVQDPVFLHDSEFRVLRANRAYASLTGQPIQDIIGKPYWEVCPKREGPLPHCCGLLTNSCSVQSEEVVLDNGQRFLSRGFAVRDAEAEFLYSVHIMQDITEKHRLQATLEETANRYRALFLGAPDAIFVADAETGQLIDANPAAERLIGRTHEEILTLHQSQLHPPDAQAKQIFGEHVRNGSSEAAHPPTSETTVMCADGRIVPVEITAHAFRLDGRLVLQGVFRDISERKAAEEQLAATDKHLNFSLNLLTNIVESIPMRVFWKDRELRFMGCNSRFASDAGFTSPDELVNKTDLEMSWKAEAKWYREDDRQVIETGQPKLGYEEPQRTPDGKTVWLRTSKVPLRGEGQEIIGVLGIYDDITQQKQAEQDLQLSESRLKESQTVARLGSWELNLVNNTLWWSDENYRIFDVKPGEANNYETFLDTVHPDDKERVNQAYTTSINNRTTYDIEHRLLLKDGTVKWVHERCKTYYDEDGKPLRSSGTTLDITEQRQTQRALNQSNRALKTISRCNSVLVHAHNEMELLHDMCRVIVEDGGYRFAWIGFIDNEVAMSIKPVAHAGYEKGYLKRINVSYGDNERGHGPAGTAIRTGQLDVINNIQEAANFAPWRDAAAERRYRSVVALPLKDETQDAFGVLCIYAQETNAFGPEALRLLQEMTSDIAYGLMSLRTRNERDHYYQQHRKSDELYKQALVDTIRAVAMTVEKRDPYTAGHQYKVAQLSVAIGREMGLDKERLEGVRLGALIHDIGKIYVPAEILNRPGRLSSAEFEIIKSHPEVGYDIIKDVQFPWPVADMVVQHHERLDGSGYPKGLAGEDIILEARILAVADVVDAITSHRPYRPAIGLDKGLMEIEAHRGTLYDHQVVDACLRLIRDKGFSFDAEPQH